MSIAEGQTAVYTTDIRSSELVVADLTDAKEDIETIIPGRLLKPEAKFDERQLPFVVEVHNYHPHSTLFNKKAKLLIVSARKYLILSKTWRKLKTSCIAGFCAYPNARRHSADYRA